MCCHLMTEHIRQTQGSQKHIAVAEYEADSKVTGAHRVNRPLPYGGDYISCEIRNGLTGLERRW